MLTYYVDCMYYTKRPSKKRLLRGFFLKLKGKFDFSKKIYKLKWCSVNPLKPKCWLNNSPLRSSDIIQINFILFLRPQLNFHIDDVP